MRSLCLSIPFLLAAACAGPTDDDAKDDISAAPFAALDSDGKADSAQHPVDKGLLKVGRYAEGEFTASAGWVAHTIYLTAGEVDVFASGHQADGSTPQDTVVYVFGPMRDKGGFPGRAIAFNDDEEPGSVFSHARVRVPADGVYRVVVSTYANWRAYPRNPSRGTWRVIVKCPRAAGAYSCGHAAAYEGGGCFADNDCVNGLRCQGEIVCPPDTLCLWTKPGQCVVDDAWLAYAPRQCGMNPWSDAAGDDETGRVSGFFASRNVRLQQVGFLDSAVARAVCLACECPRGDTLLVRAPAADVPRLEREFGFQRVTDDSLLAISPRKCGENGWAESGGDGAELESFISWAADHGAAPLSVAGFVHFTEPRVTCAACTCGRGDLLVVGAESVEATSALLELGFDFLYHP